MSQSDAYNGMRFLIIGAGGGIGSALCGHLADAGASIIAASRNEEHLKDVKDRCDAQVHTVDARDADATEELFTEVSKDGAIHGAVNLAGSILLKPAHNTKFDEFREEVETNLYTAFNVTRAASKVMQRQDDGGSVVLMSTAVARHGFPAHEATAAAKAGVEGLMRSAAAGYAKKSVRFNCVAPGLVRTPLSKPVFDSEPMLKASLSMHADGKPAEPEQVASAIAWLLHPTQSHVTGSVIGVDGGLSSLHAK